MKKYTVTLGNPCTFGWNNMTTAEKVRPDEPFGRDRHCAQCDKTVVDFSVMTDEQVIDYLLTHKNVCGHFNKSQLGRTMLLHSPKRKNIFHWPSVAAMLVAGVFQVIPTQVNAKKPITTIQTIESGLNGIGNKMIQSPQNLSSDNDSLINIKIKVIDTKSKKAIANAHINFANLGNFTTDSKGYFLFSTSNKNLPQTIKIIGYADTYYQLIMEVNVQEFIKKPFFQLEMWYNDPNLQVDGGEIYIKQE